MSFLGRMNMLICISLFGIVSLSTPAVGQLGGLSPTKEADLKVQSLINSVRDDAEDQANTSFDEYTAIAYKTQVVAGVNYFIKVKVGSNDFVHMRLFEPLPYTEKPAELISLQIGKTADDEILSF